VLGGAAIVGSIAFVNGLVALALLTDVSDEPRRRLFDINVFLGTAMVTLTLGGVLVYQAASSLGRTGSSAMTLHTNARLIALALFLAFPLLVAYGQVQVRNPETMPWLFPITNTLIVSIPSLVIAVVVADRYLQHNRWAWPISWREWSSGIIYGAIGATFVGAILNTTYIIFMARLVIGEHGFGDPWDLNNLQTLPRGWGVFFDISVLSIFAPLNEEFWKGMLVAFFFFRKGGAARCFLWGALAGAGFNILETFQNSLSITNPSQISQQQLSSDWWLFAIARAGTAALHSASTGLAALGFYGAFRGDARYLWGYPLGALLHGCWNFCAYTLGGDAILSGSGPDSTTLDVLSVLAMIGIFAGCVAILWEVPRRIHDGFPAPIYQLLGMVPSGQGPFAGRQRARRPKSKQSPNDGLLWYRDPLAQE